MPRRHPGEALRIFIDPSGYRWNSLGDVLMLEVALQRLRARWPCASIRVHGFDAEPLQRLDPQSRALDPTGSLGWSADAVRLGRSLGPLRYLRRRRSPLMRQVARAAVCLKRRDPRLVDQYLDAVQEADLVLLTGAGSLNDAFRPQALVRLETLELALAAGAVTALLGQGIGPMSMRGLFARAAAVLPRADFISLREAVVSRPLLESMGVPACRVVVAGDDAIAPAYQARAATVGSGLGVNLRAAPYSGIGGRLVDGIGRVVREAARRHHAPLVPLPISRSPEEDDLETAHRMLGTPAPGGEGHEAWSPAALLLALPQCRAVVAGSYHAAVLALSMGIPVVAVAQSEYYVGKFQGLAGQFGPSCRVELASSPDLPARLGAAIDEVWASAEAARGPLLAAAARQIAASEAAYAHLFALVESRRQER